MPLSARLVMLCGCERIPVTADTWATFVMALIALILAGYALYEILSNAQDVWLSR